MRLVDSHCHFNLLDLTETKDDLSPFIQRAQEADVCHFLNVCVSIANFNQVLSVAEQYPFISASVGLHPNEEKEEVTYDELITLGNHPKVVAIGETGLDYYRTYLDKTTQLKRFVSHIHAAQHLKKPLIIHTRHAIDDTLRIMQEENATSCRGVMHCFTEEWTYAKKALDMGFYISISGIVTFKTAEAVREVAQKTPLDRLLIETDSPYLAPLPMRGKANEPAFVKHTAEFIATLRQVPLETFAHQTTENFFTLFTEAKRSYV